MTAATALDSIRAALKQVKPPRFDRIVVRDWRIFGRFLQGEAMRAAKPRLLDLFLWRRRAPVRSSRGCDMSTGEERSAASKLAEL